MLDGTGVRVATLGYYCNAIENPDHWETLRHVVEMAPLFGAPMVSTFAGAYEGKSVEDAMPKFKEVFTDITKRAADKGLKVAIENCPMGGSWQHCTCNIGFNPQGLGDDVQRGSGGKPGSGVGARPSDHPAHRPGCPAAPVGLEGHPHARQRCYRGHGRGPAFGRVRRP